MQSKKRGGGIFFSKESSKKMKKLLVPMILLHFEQIFTKKEYREWRTFYFKKKWKK